MPRWTWIARKADGVQPPSETWAWEGTEQTEERAHQSGVVRGLGLGQVCRGLGSHVGLVLFGLQRRLVGGGDGLPTL